MALRPDLMPVEQHAAKAFVWQWLREDVTYHICYDQEQELIDAVINFQNQINTNPVALRDRMIGQKTSYPKKKNYGFQSRRGLYV